MILLSDFRFQGGTSHSNAEEIVAQAATGVSTGLLQVSSPLLKKARPINPVVQRCVDAGLAAFIPPRAASRCKLLVVRHPTVLQHTRREMPAVEAERVVVIVNQPPLDHKKGGLRYEVADLQARAHRFFGSAGMWFPIGPLVRRAIERQPGVRNLAAEDWCNIIDVAGWRVDRAAYAGDRPILGRHSRDSTDKWPATREEVLHAYPDGDEFRVRILGGAESARQLLGQLPAAWEVLDFGAMDAREFLAGIDFFVYYHHPTWVEAFGRTILEALASGAPAILPAHFAELFQEAAIYAEPAQVGGVVRDLYADRARYQARSRAGIEFVEARFSHAAHVRRLREVMRPDAPWQVEKPRWRVWGWLSPLSVARPRPARPRLRLDLGERSITAAMATYPARRDVAPAAIDRLVTQVDRLFVYLNNYDEVPAFIRTHRHRERIVFILDPASERRAGAKFHWLRWIRGYHLLCDDDLLYPRDYAARMVDAVERARRRAIVGVPGVLFDPLVDDARTSRRQVFRAREALAADRPVHFLGSGAAALHSDVLPSIDLSQFHAYPIANDELLAVSAKQAGVPLICVAREAGWLEPHPGKTFGIFEERSIDRAAHEAATRLLASANPWPPLPTAVAPDDDTGQD